MNEIDANIDKLKNDQIKLAGTFNRVFSTQDGKEILALLKNETMGSTLSGNMFMDMDSTINPAEFMCIREGQNSIVRFINKLLKYYGDYK